MIANRGINNEIYIKDELDKKLVKDLNPNLKTMLTRIYGRLNEEEMIHCQKIEGSMKPDIKVTYKGISKYISIKSGHANYVHEEQMCTLIEYFKEAGMHEEDIEAFKRLVYRDGTNDGSGERKLEYIESRIHFKETIDLFNERVNGNKTLVEKIVNHCLFKGANKANIEADYIYFGTVNFGVLCSKTQINKHISRRTWEYMENPHIGPLQFRMHCNSKNNPKSTQCDFWWARLREDLEYIEERYWG